MPRDAPEAPPRLPVAPLFRPAAGGRSPGAPACTPVPSLSCRGLGPPCLPDLSRPGGEGPQRLARRRFAGYDHMTHFMGFSVVAFCRPF